MSKQESNKNYQIIGYFYLILAITFLLMGFGIFQNIYYNMTLKYQYFGSLLLIFGGWEGLALIFLSIVYLFTFKIKKALISGIIGCILIGFNMILFLFDYYIRSSMGQRVVFILFFYIDFAIWIIFCFVNAIIYIQKSRLEVTISKEEKPEERIPEGMKYCSSCGEKIKKQATYCEFCGAAQ